MSSELEYINTQPWFHLLEVSPPQFNVKCQLQTKEFLGMSIISNCTDRIAWKLQTNCPRRYIVSHQQGIIEPKQHKDCVILLTNLKQIPDIKPTDTFVIQATKINSHIHVSDLPQLWKDRESKHDKKRGVYAYQSVTIPCYLNIEPDLIQVVTATDENKYSKWDDLDFESDDDILPTQNKPTNKGFKIFVKLQFGKTITVYGLNNNSTMLDIQKKLEVIHGASSAKIDIGQWRRLRLKGIIHERSYIHSVPKGISNNMWFEENIPFKDDEKYDNNALFDEYKKKKWELKQDMKLKDLGITANSTVIWNTVFTKFKSSLTNNVHNNVSNINEKMSYKRKIILDKILSGDNVELTLFGKMLQIRGWCLIEYPKEIKNVTQKTFDTVYNAMKNKIDGKDDKKNEWKQLFDVYGYVDFKNYKQVLRVLTGSLMKTFKDEYPQTIVDDLQNISDVIDKLSLQLLDVMVVNKNIFDFKSMDEFSKKSQKNDCNITILNGYKGDNKNAKCQLLDFVYYDNIDDKKQTSEYPMIENNLENVGAHTDPGLFSLSFLSTSDGLQLYDVGDNCWRVINNDCGVFWNGEAAAKISGGKLLSGIHRVVFNEKKPRFTSWYECSVDSQVTKAVIQ